MLLLDMEERHSGGAPGSVQEGEERGGEGEERREVEGGEERRREEERRRGVEGGEERRREVEGGEERRREVEGRREKRVEEGGKESGEMEEGCHTVQEGESRRRVVGEESKQEEKEADKIHHGSEKEQIEAELASLCTPCKMEFTARIKLQEQAAERSSVKKRKKGAMAAGGGMERAVCVELDWIEGDQDKDLLHQLLQYLQNKMNSIDFQQEP